MALIPTKKKKKKSEASKIVLYNHRLVILSRHVKHFHLQE